MSSPFEPRQEAERILAAIVESSEDAIIAKDLGGTILAWNASAEVMYGYTSAEMIGRSIAVIVPPDCPKELQDITDRIRQGERVQHFETTRIAKGGRRVEVSLSVSPIKDASGAIVGASTIARDITVKNSRIRQLADSEERLRSVVEAAVDGIIVIDDRGLIEAFNPGAERLFGYTAAEVSGKNVNMLMPEPYHSEHDGYMRHYVETASSASSASAVKSWRDARTAAPSRPSVRRRNDARRTAQVHRHPPRFEGARRD